MIFVSSLAGHACSSMYGEYLLPLVGHIYVCVIIICHQVYMCGHYLLPLVGHIYVCVIIICHHVYMCDHYLPPLIGHICMCDDHLPPCVYTCDHHLPPLVGHVYMCDYHLPPCVHVWSLFATTGGACVQLYENMVQGGKDIVISCRTSLLEQCWMTKEKEKRHCWFICWGTASINYKNGIMSIPCLCVCV